MRSLNGVRVGCQNFVLAKPAQQAPTNGSSIGSMKIIFANRYFYPDQSATSRVVSSLAIDLAKRGYEIHAITSRWRHDGSGNPLPAFETIEGVKVTRLWTFGRGRVGVVGRVIDYAMFHLSAAWWWMKNVRRDDLCIICTDPPLLTVTGAAVLGLSGAKRVEWILDLFPEVAMELGMIDRRSLPARILLALRNWSHGKTDLLICPINGMATYLLSCSGSRLPATATVPLWSDGEEIRPINRHQNPLRGDWGLKDCFVVGYSGNFGRAHDFRTLLDAAEALSQETDIRFLMIGNGQQWEFVKSEVAARNLENVLFQPFQPTSRVAESLGAADVHIVSLKPSLEHCIIPSKFYGILAAGRPTIFVGDPAGEIASALRSASCGEAVRPGEALALAAHIISMRNDPGRVEAMGVNARQLFDSEYTLGKGVARWVRAVAPFVDGRTPHINAAAPDGVIP